MPEYIIDEQDNKKLVSKTQRTGCAGCNEQQPEEEVQPVAEPENKEGAE